MARMENGNGDAADIADASCGDDDGGNLPGKAWSKPQAFQVSTPVCKSVQENLVHELPDQNRRLVHELP